MTTFIKNICLQVACIMVVHNAILMESASCGPVAPPMHFKNIHYHTSSAMDHILQASDFLASMSLFASATYLYPIADLGLESSITISCNLWLLK